LPKDAYDNIRMAKFHQIMNSSALDAEAITKNYTTLVKALGDNEKAIQSLDAMKTMVEMMNERAVGNISPAYLENSKSLKDRAMRIIIGMKPNVSYAIKKASEAISQQKSDVSENALMNLAKKIQSAKPTPVYAPSPFVKPLSQAVITSMGKETQ
jgi:DNA primase large subunit